MRSVEKIIREVEDRNKARAKAGLPLVSVSKEIKKISEAELYQDFRVWRKANPKLRDKVAEEVLATFRKDLRNPTWVPRGLLSGGRWGYLLAVEKKLERLWEKRKEL